MEDKLRAQARKTIYYLTKGVCKSIPVLGSILEEVVFNQIEDSLEAKLQELSDSEIESMLQRLPTTEQVQALERKVSGVGEELRIWSAQQFLTVLDSLAATRQGVASLDERLEEMHQDIGGLQTIIPIMNELRELAQQSSMARVLLQRLEERRKNWIERLSDSQKRLLAAMPHEATPISALWELTRTLLPSCGYKEFRFRLHEFEWLGLVDRERQDEWYYWRISSLSKIQGLDV